MLIPPSRSRSAAGAHLAAKAGLGLLVQPPAAAPAWGKPAPVQPAAHAKQQEQQEQQPPQVHIMDDAAYPPLVVAMRQEGQRQQSQRQEEQQPAVSPGPHASSSDSSDSSGSRSPSRPGTAAAADQPSSTLPAKLPSAPLPSHQPQQLQVADVAAAEQGEVAVLAAEVAVLRAEVARLRLQQRQAEVAHQEELASVLEDTAAHEAAAVAQAVAAERLHCIYRFAAFLQVHGLAPGRGVRGGVRGPLSSQLGTLERLAWRPRGRQAGRRA